MNAQRWEEIQVSFDQLVDLDVPRRNARLAMLASSVFSRRAGMHRRLSLSTESQNAETSRGLRRLMDFTMDQA